jgi:hypothetical protein
MSTRTTFRIDANTGAPDECGIALLLIAQAQAEDCRIVTRDEAFDRYGVSRLW